MTTSETNPYPLLGDILNDGVVPEGGCCEMGPSYACHICGMAFCERPAAAQEATEFFARLYS